MWGHLHLAPSEVTDCLLSPSGAPFLHLSQNQEDRHRCLCEGDPGRGLVGGGALDPLWPRGAVQPSVRQCLPTPISYCQPGLGHPGGIQGAAPA